MQQEMIKQTILVMNGSESGYFAEYRKEWTMLPLPIKNQIYYKGSLIIAVAQLVECETWDQMATSLRLTRGTVLCPSARLFILCFVLVQPWSGKTEKCPDMTEKFLIGM